MRYDTTIRTLHNAKWHILSLHGRNVRQWEFKEVLTVPWQNSYPSPLIPSPLQPLLTNFWKSKCCTSWCQSKGLGGKKDAPEARATYPSHCPIKKYHYFSLLSHDAYKTGGQTLPKIWKCQYRSKSLFLQFVYIWTEAITATKMLVNTHSVTESLTFSFLKAAMFLFGNLTYHFSLLVAVFSLSSFKHLLAIFLPAEVKAAYTINKTRVIRTHKIPLLKNVNKDSQKIKNKIVKCSPK